MAFTPRARFLSLALMATVVAAALPASAQVRKDAPQRLPAGTMKPLDPVAAAPVTRHRARVDGLRDSGQAALDPQLPEGWALSGFHLGFRNGDHKLRRIGVLPEGRFVRFALADQNGDDPFGARATFTGIPGVKVQQVVADGGGKFEIPLPGEAPANSTLVLSGFEFRRTDGTDANLRNIAVWTDPGHNRIIVSLTDDQGMDFRGLEATLGAVAVNAVMPLPGIMETVTPIASTVALQRATQHGIRKMSGKYRGYRVSVQYAWIPRSRVEREGALAGGDRRHREPPSRIDALQGFEFTFNNGDHHLLGLGINSSGRGDIMFQDNNTDDPIQWSAAYLTLK